jgi:hypothetical protein
MHTIKKNIFVQLSVTFIPNLGIKVSVNVKHPDQNYILVRWSN